MKLCWMYLKTLHLCFQEFINQVTHLKNIVTPALTMFLLMAFQVFVRAKISLSVSGSFIPFFFKESLKPVFASIGSAG